jgi:hypothetical protein
LKGSSEKNEKRRSLLSRKRSKRQKKLEVLVPEEGSVQGLLVEAEQEADLAM